MDSSPTFGDALRRLREQRGLTLVEMSLKVPCSPGHLSRIERGRRVPTLEFARACDDALGADGALAALLAGTSIRRAAPAPEPGGHPATTDAGETLAHRPVEDLLGLLHAQFDRLRLDGRRLPARDVLGEVRRLMGIATHFGESSGSTLLLPLAARSAELAGWLAQDSGDHHEALRLTATAAELSERVGDRDAVAYTLVRRAEMKMYARKPTEAIELAHSAVTYGGALARTRGIGHHRAAQAYAMLGDQRGCFRELDAAAEALRGDGEPSGTYGPATVRDPTRLVRGWCLYRLGRFAEAAEVLDAAVAEVPGSGLRLRGLFSARLARAYAEAGELDNACAAGRQALACVRSTRSATTLGQLQPLSALLGRHPSHEPAERLRLDIVAELARGTR